MAKILYLRAFMSYMINTSNVPVDGIDVMCGGKVGNVQVI
jgi:hypothetical protein